MGGIDLDPASSEIANKTVRAERYFAEEDDGLSQEWTGRVWMNPPYARGTVERFVDKLLSEPIDQAIILVNNATETTWGARLLASASIRCFPRTRIRFQSPHGKAGAPLQGQMIVGLSVDRGSFERWFSDIGPCF